MPKLKMNLFSIFDGSYGICKECGWEILNCPHLDICYKCRDKLNENDQKFRYPEKKDKLK